MIRLQEYFHKKPKTVMKTYDPTEWKPAIRCSICTGEQTAGMKNRNTGRFEELMLIRSEADLKEFCRISGANQNSIEHLY